MSKKSVPIPRPAPCWFFRDRFGRRHGPYADAKEVRVILSNHYVGKVFAPVQEEGYWKLYRYGEATELVMEDGEHNPVCPGDWLDAEKEKRRETISAAYKKRRGRHVHRSGPVAGIHKFGNWKMWRTPNFGRKVRDTGYGCPEDGEPPIRVKLRVHDYCGEDFSHHRVWKSWKRYRGFQWRGG